MQINDEPYVFVHALHWRRQGTMLVMAQRHGLLSMEEFDAQNDAHQWRIGRNGEIFTNIRGERRYIHHMDECATVKISRESSGGWAFDALGEHPYKYRVVPRYCPSFGLRSTLGSRTVGLETVWYNDDSNAWYILPYRLLTESRRTALRPMS